MHAWVGFGDVAVAAWRLARLLFWGRWVCFEGGEGGMVCLNVRRKCNRLWVCVWDGEIDDTEIEGRQPEKV